MISRAHGGVAPEAVLKHRRSLRVGECAYPSWQRHPRQAPLDKLHRHRHVEFEARQGQWLAGHGRMTRRLAVEKNARLPSSALISAATCSARETRDVDQGTCEGKRQPNGASTVPEHQKNGLPEEHGTFQNLQAADGCSRVGCLALLSSTAHGIISGDRGGGKGPRRTARYLETKRPDKAEHLLRLEKDIFLLAILNSAGRGGGQPSSLPSTFPGLYSSKLMESGG